MPEDTYSIWGDEGGCTMTVLECVFSWLSGRELARVGEVCRVWRFAAAAPTHWRHLLLTKTKAPLTAIRTLSGHVANGELNPGWSWRNEYVNAAAGWQRLKMLRPPECEAGETDASATILQHAALNSTGELLAVAGDDASVSVWVRTSECGTNWKMAWRTSLRRRGWRSAARVIWAPPPSPGHEERLLIAGPLALADRWELLIIELSEDCESGRILARAGCSNGAAGCWASRDAFLSLELRLLAPRRAVTTIWLNAATQEAQSEFTGVSAPVLRIYNEAQANISHITVAEVPTECEEELSALSQDAKYMRVTLSEGIINEKSVNRLVIAGCGQEGGTIGIATAIGCWWLGTLRVPPLVAALGGGLAERVARRRHNPRGIEPEPPPPSEHDLRELCSPPTALYTLQGRLLGVTTQPNGRCIWAVDASGRATCLALPLLDVLRVLHTVSVNPVVRPYYVQPAVSQWLIASPMCGDGSIISIWSALSGAEYTPPAAISATILAVLLPPTNTQQPKVLLCIAGDAIYVWENRATSQLT